MTNEKQLRSQKTYLNLSAEFYDLSRPSVAADEFAFYGSFVQETKGRILEPMCGSGRFLIPFIENGFRIDGFDASSFMLEALYQKCKSKGNFLSKCKIWQGFLQDLDTPTRYDLVLIPDGSFNLILNVEEINLCLKKIYEHLAQGGRFVFELVTLKYAKHIEVGACNNSMVMRPDEKKIFKKVHILPFEGQIAKTKSYCELRDRDEKQVLKTEIEDSSLFLHKPEDVNIWLKDLGFRDIRHKKAFDRNLEGKAEDALIVIECRK